MTNTPAQMNMQAHAGANPFESAARMVSSEMPTLGFDLSGEKREPLSDSELLEAAYYEKAEERGFVAI